MLAGTMTSVNCGECGTSDKTYCYTSYMTAKQPRGRHAFLAVLFSVFLIPAVLFSASPSAPPAWGAPCVAPLKALRLGMSSNDVRTLQVFLNRDPDTRVATEGPGAPGSETTYFGLRTKQAVIKFQEKYRSEILSPARLSAGSGYVGPLTIAKMTALCVHAAKEAAAPALPVAPAPPPLPVPILTPAVNSTATPALVLPPSALPPPVTNDAAGASAFSGMTFRTDVMELMYPSRYVATRGTSMIIYGLGFPKSGNIVRLGGLSIASTTVDAGGMIHFTVPADAPFGKHELWIANAKGETTRTFLIVQDPSVSPPVITDFEPKKGYLGTEITITGSGFTPTGNTIRVTYGTIENVPSPDGKTLRFIVRPNLPDADFTGDIPEIEDELPLWFSVMNNNGVSESSIFTIMI